MRLRFLRRLPMGNSDDWRFFEWRKASYFVPYFPTVVQKKFLRFLQFPNYKVSGVSAESHVGPASASSMSECTIPVASCHGVQRALINCIMPEKTVLTPTDNWNQQEGLLDNPHKARQQEEETDVTLRNVAHGGRCKISVYQVCVQLVCWRRATAGNCQVPERTQQDRKYIVKNKKDSCSGPTSFADIRVHLLKG